MSLPPAPARPATDAAIRYAVAMLVVVYTFNYLDRQIVNILAEPIKTDLGLADWQIGLISGFAFVIFYTVLGVPLARYADRPTTNRVRLISICLALWSGMTALCGMAGNFLHLTLARFGVGVGEAGCSPSAHSLISDLVPREKRASALGVYALGIPLGKLLGLGMGGLIAQALGWRAAFFILGLPGLVLALVTWFTLPEPRKHTPAGDGPDREGLLPALAALRRNRTFLGVTFAGMFMVLVSAGQNAFLGSLLIRVHGMSVGEAGIFLGLALGGGGALGTLLGGRIVDHHGGRDARAYVLIPTLAVLLGGSLFLASVLVQDGRLAVLLIGAAAVMNQSWYGPVFAVVQGVSPPARRATAAAVHICATNLVGAGLGPLFIGALSDAFNAGFSLGPLVFDAAGPSEGLRLALACAAFAPLIAILGFIAAAKAIRAEMRDE